MDINRMCYYNIIMLEIFNKMYNKMIEPFYRSKSNWYDTNYKSSNNQIIFVLPNLCFILH